MLLKIFTVIVFTYAIGIVAFFAYDVRKTYRDLKDFLYRQKRGF